MRHRACVVAFAIAGTAFARDARAESQTVRDALALTSGACLAPDSLAVAIASSLGRGEVDARLRVIVKETDDVVSVDIERNGQRVGNRLLPVRSLRCETTLALVRFTAAAAIAATEIAEDKDAAPESPVPPPPPPPPPPPQPSVPRRAPEAPTATPRVRAGAFVEAVALGNLVRGVSLGLAAGGQLRLFEVVDLRLGALQTLDTSLPVGPFSTDVQLLAGELLACAVVRTERHILLRPCLGTWVGRFLGRGQGFPMSTETYLPFVSGLARVDASYRVTSRFHVLLFVTGWVSMTSAELEAQTLRGQPAYDAQLPTVGLAGGVGTFVTF